LAAKFHNINKMEQETLSAAAVDVAEGGAGEGVVGQEEMFQQILM
jgi:hypothetical protein